MSKSIHRLYVGTRLSEAAIHNQVVYLAGQIAEDASQDITGQAQQVLKAVDKLLEESGSHKSQILMAQIYLADLKDFSALNAVWDAWVVPGHTPPRATIQAQLAKPEWKVEVVVTAAVL